MNLPEVKLIAYTQGVEGESPEQILAEAFSQCYQKAANVKTIIRHMKHMSVLEHVSFVLRIKCSRVCFEQLVRHRIASFTAQSHRFTEITKEDCYDYIPDEVIELGEEAVLEWISDLENTHAKYKKWLKRISKENARYQAPTGIAIRAVITFNLRSLLNMLSLRTNKKAQEEMQKLAFSIWKEIKHLFSFELAQKFENLFLSGNK